MKASREKSIGILLYKTQDNRWLWYTNHL